jgi:DNA-binding NarL/FixJ family response regulator
LRLVAHGRTNPEIAGALSIGEGTVRTHLRRIFLKLGASDRTQAAVRALEAGALRL